MVFQCINIRQVPREVLKTAASGLGFQHLPQVLKTAASGLGFQHLPPDLANVNAWKTMFDPCIDNFLICQQKNTQWVLIIGPFCVTANKYPQHTISSRNTTTIYLNTLLSRALETKSSIKYCSNSLSYPFKVSKKCVM